MNSSLLQLPGELRNRIYEFALSEEKGLYYRLDNGGVGWLCLYKDESQADKDGERGSEVEAAEDSKNEEGHRKRREIGHGTDSTWEHINTESPDNRDLVTVDGGHVVANQLQFVNRLLHCETKALGIRYNTLVFHGATPEVGSTFLNGLPASKKKEIRTIILKPDASDSVLDICAPFAIACKAYPQWLLKLYFPRISLEIASNVLTVAYILSYVARGNGDLIKRLSDSPVMHERLTQLWAGVLPERHTPPLPSNVLMFPFNERFDEAVFKVSCEQDPFVRDRLIPTLNKGVDALIAVVKDWCENGL